VEASPRTVFHRRYEIVRKIASGGMATVYEVVDRRTGRRRALKIMLPTLAADADLRARFEREARVTAEIESDHLVETFDAGIDRETGSPFLVMELLRGEDLHAILQRRGRLPPEEVTALLAQAASALDRTHEAGIVHRDLTPQNLFVAERQGDAPVLKILDFGISKLIAVSTQSKGTTRNLGTPMYMSPEQIRGDGDIDQRADVYSLAHIAYALLVGEAYWAADATASGNMYALLMKVARGGQDPASVRASKRGVTLGPELDAWFAKATAPDAAMRFDSAGEAIRALSLALSVAREGSPAALATAPVPPRALRRSRTSAWVGLGVALLGASASVVSARWGRPPREVAVPVAGTVAIDTSAASAVEAQAMEAAASAPPPVADAVASAAPSPPASSVQPAPVPRTPRRPARKPAAVDPSDLR
jgi:serine/threonine-protein kinase